MGIGNLYRIIGIMFGKGKFIVIKICEDFMEILICYKNEFIKFLEDIRDVECVIRKMEDIVVFLNIIGVIDGFYIIIKVFYINYEDYFNRK